MDKLNVELAIDLVSEDIIVLRGIMNEVSEHVESLSHPIMIKISQLMDHKLNHREALLLMHNSTRGSNRPKLS